MSKYQGLDYIAEGAEVFESPDTVGRGHGLAYIDDEEPPESQVSERHKAIDTTPISSLSVASLTERLAQQDSSRPFFIDGETLQWVAQGPGSSSSGPFGQDGLFRPIPQDNERETALIKFGRLRLELEQLENQLQSGPAPVDQANVSHPPTSSMSMLNELTKMKTRLLSLDPGLQFEAGLNHGRRRLSELNDVKADSADAEQHSATAPSLPTYSSVLDQRLAVLEEVIGVSEYTIHKGQMTPQIPLGSSLAALRVQLAALSSPRLLESITRRLKDTLSELEKVSGTRRRLAGWTKDGKGIKERFNADDGCSAAQLRELAQLSSLLPQLEMLIPLMQPILNTIQSSRSLHSRALHVDQSLDQLERLANEMQDLNTTISESCRRLEASIEENEDRTKKNLESMASRMRQMGLDR